MSKILFNLIGYFFRVQGIKNINIGNLPKAELMFSRALKWFDKCYNFQQGFDCQIQLGNIYKVSYLFDMANEMFNSALLLAKKHNDKKTIIIAMINLGMLYGAQEKYDEAVENYEKALELADEIIELKSQIFHSYGILEQQRQNFEKSAEFLTKAINECEAIDEIPSQALIYSDLGEIYSFMENEEKAIDSWKKSLLIYERYNDDIGKANVLLNLGQITNDIDFIKQALNINNLYPGRELAYANCCTSLALILIENKKYTEASNLLLDAIEIENNQGQTSAIVRDYANLAYLNKEKGDDELFETYLEYAYQIANETDDEVMLQELSAAFGTDSNSK